jgi:hypothetical protein
VECVLGSKRQALQALKAPAAGFLHDGYTRESLPSQDPQTGAEQQQDERNRRYLLKHFHSKSSFG